MNKTIATFGGVSFGVKFELGRQVSCEPVCPNCGQDLEKSAIPGQDMMLLCPSENKGCTTPVMGFRTEEEMAQFLNKACTEIEKRKASSEK